VDSGDSENVHRYEYECVSLDHDRVWSPCHKWRRKRFSLQCGV